MDEIEVPKLLVSTHQLASLMCNAYGEGAYVALGLADPRDPHAAQILGSWAGPRPAGFSRAPYAAHAKLAEMLLLGNAYGITYTPTDSFELGLGWMGGVRDGMSLVGVSKWAQEHDKLLALILAYAMDQEVRFHHVGRRYPTEDAMRRASRERHLAAIHVPADDHIRLYHKVTEPLAPNGYYYYEDQFFQDGPHDNAVHWDLATSKPENMLAYVAKAYDAVPTYFPDADKYDPVGVVWIPDKDGNLLGLMTRYRWWDIESTL